MQPMARGRKNSAHFDSDGVNSNRQSPPGFLAFGWAGQKKAARVYPWGIGGAASGIASGIVDCELAPGWLRCEPTAVPNQVWLRELSMIKTFASATLLVSLLLLISGCADGSEQCLGSAVSCEERAPAQCTDGCAPVDGCHGGAVSCESLTDDGLTLCNQTSGCRWVGQCDGVAGCGDRDYETCEDQVGCTKVRRCFGDGTTCEGTERTQCELYPQCTLGASCLGEALQCEDLGSTAQCNSVPGCFAADTSPAILD